MAELFQPYPHPRYAALIAFAWNAVGHIMPHWWGAGGWRQRLWVHVASERWGWYERSQGRL